MNYKLSGQFSGKKSSFRIESNAFEHDFMLGNIDSHGTSSKACQDGERNKSGKPEAQPAVLAGVEETVTLDSAEDSFHGQIQKSSVSRWDSFHVGRCIEPEDLRARKWIYNPILMRKKATLLASQDVCDYLPVLSMISACVALGCDIEGWAFEHERVRRVIVFDPWTDRRDQESRLRQVCARFHFDADKALKNIEFLGSENFSLWGQLQVWNPNPDPVDRFALAKRIRETGAGLLALGPMAIPDAAFDQWSSEFQPWCDFARQLDMAVLVAPLAPDTDVPAEQVAFRARFMSGDYSFIGIHGTRNIDSDVYMDARPFKDIDIP